jgi:hypothetical protein
MGEIRNEVRAEHLDSYPQEEDLLKPFLNGFYITWGRKRKSYNTDLSVYFLNPEAFITEIFGFTQEILLVYSPYPRMETRTIQAAESFLTDDPGKGRVEKINYIIISEADDVEAWVQSYALANQESKIIVAFSAKELRNSKGDSWFVRNTLNRQLYGRDLFDYRLPLQDDTYFFGRKDILASFNDSIKRAENRGLFGLRKTGKTSFLYKLERIINSEGKVSYLYYDCKSPSVRKLRWFDLLANIIGNICDKYALQPKGKLDEVNIAETFARLLLKIPDNARIVLVFDEIEYISPLAISDNHWKQDFIDFWQTFWTCQSRYRKISTVIAGVNPSVVEIDTFSGIQNPLFGIVSHEFLKGFEFDELQIMLRVLGKRMGLQFDEDAVKYLHQRYGGHPLLTRIACGLINKSVTSNNEARPVKLDRPKLIRGEDIRDSEELVFYCRHVMSELRQFYPDEYQMLEYLASGQTTAFMELSVVPEYVSHLRSYGLLSADATGSPTISIPVVKRYVGLELARREGRQTIYKIIDQGHRENWLHKRVRDVINDLRLLEKLIQQNSTPSLFGTNSFPEADMFLESRVCYSQDDFDSFTNKCNRCFVESVEKYGASLSNKKYFWNEIKQSYPGLFHALHRIKIYRNHQMHIILDPSVNEQLLDFLSTDLEGKSPSQVNDLYFILQQCILDGLMTGVQLEISRLN